MGHFVSNFISQALLGRDITVYGGGEQAPAGLGAVPGMMP
jgi:hypothetical protein